MHASIYGNTHTYLHASMHACVRACVRAFVRSCVRACMCVKTQTHPQGRDLSPLCSFWYCLRVNGTSNSAAQYLCTDMCKYMRNMGIDMWTDIFMDMGADMRVDMCTEMCMDRWMGREGRYTQTISAVLRRANYAESGTRRRQTPRGHDRREGLGWERSSIETASLVYRPCRSVGTRPSACSEIQKSDAHAGRVGIVEAERVRHAVVVIALCRTER